MSNGRKLIEEKAKAKYKILFVDDEKPMLHSIARGLHRKGFNAIYSESAEEALEILVENTDIGLVVSDLKMPGMNGIEFLKIVNKSHPDIIKIVLTGHAQIPNILATINESNIFKYLVKPWKLDEEFIPALTESLYMYYMNAKREELAEQEFLHESKGNKFKLDKEQIAYFESVLEILKHSENDIYLINKVSEKLPVLEKSNIERLSLDIYSRSKIIYSNLVSVSNVVENIIAMSEKDDEQ